MTNRANITAVVVAYNRSELLREAIHALRAQTYAVSSILVVDNASTDDSAEVARACGEDVTVVSLDRNTGGAGGFAAGIALALADAADLDWVWLMDDDTIPTATAAQSLMDVVKGTDVALAGSRVVWMDGTEHPMNTPRERPFLRAAARDAARLGGVTEVRSSSFVSMLVAVDAVREVGLPIADYFIWNDDFEYSTRILRHKRGVHVPSSVVVHKTKTLGSTDVDPGARFYYEVRNKLWMLRFSRGLSPVEKVVYGGSSLRRWVRTFARSSDRRTLRDGLRRGVRDGLITSPRSNAVSLGGLGDVTTAVSRAESSDG